MIIKDAVRIAKEFLQEAYEGQELVHLLLEEIRFDEASNRWYVTLGFDELTPRSSSPYDIPVPAWMAPPADRMYRVIEVDASSGRGISMKIREFATS